MPRDGFRWTAVPDSLLRRLARDLGLPADDAADSLAGTYGSRPQAEFVRDAWPTLRDVWLAKDSAMRGWVVEELRTCRLGNRELPIRTRAQQLDYLRSCRNATTLRHVVLDAFHALGEPGPAEETPQSSAEAEAATGELDLDAALETAWTEFSERLSSALAEPAGQVLAVTLPERSGSRLQIFFHRGGRRLRGELCVEFGARPLADLLDARHTTALTEAGWAPAAGAAEPHYERRVPAAEATELAGSAVQVVRNVLGVLHPAFLEPTNFWEDKDAGVERPDHGSSVTGWGSNGGGATGYVAAPDDRVIVYDIASAEQMSDLVDAALAPLFGHAPFRDEDGDIPIRLGNVMCYVRVAQEGALVRLFCPLLHGVPATPRVYKRLNKLNREYRIVRFVLDREFVVVEAELWCWPFVPALLRQALEGMAAVACAREDIQRRLGGRLFEL
jgi:hypothetical protein